jgi:3-hydroxypropanoate dehydrogenase
METNLTPVLQHGESRAPDDVVAEKLKRALNEDALRTIFLDARTANGFIDRPVQPGLLADVVRVALLGPTNANILPLRVVVVETPAAKERLRPALAKENAAKTMAAPATAIIAADLRFHENTHITFPARAEMYRGVFEALDPASRRGFAWDNAVLQMAYFIIAARAFGLDAGPMGGFDRSVVDAAFFSDGRCVSQYLVNIGFADDTQQPPRLPRLSADEVLRFE